MIGLGSTSLCISAEEMPITFPLRSQHFSVLVFIVHERRAGRQYKLCLAGYDILHAKDNRPPEFRDRRRTVPLLIQTDFCHLSMRAVVSYLFKCQIDLFECFLTEVRNAQ